MKSTRRYKLVCIPLVSLFFLFHASKAIASNVQWYNSSSNAITVGDIDENCISSIPVKSDPSFYSIECKNGTALVRPHKDDETCFDLQVYNSERCKQVYFDLCIQNLYKVLSYDGEYLYCFTDYVAPLTSSCQLIRYYIKTREICAYGTGWNLCHFHSGGNVAGLVGETVQYQEYGHAPTKLIAPMFSPSRYSTRHYTEFPDAFCWINEHTFLFWGEISFEDLPSELHYTGDGEFFYGAAYYAMRLLSFDLQTNSLEPYLTPEGREIIIYNLSIGSNMTLSPDLQSIALWVKPYDAMDQLCMSSDSDYPEVPYVLAILSLDDGLFECVFSHEPVMDTSFVAWVD